MLHERLFASGMLYVDAVDVRNRRTASGARRGILSRSATGASPRSFNVTREACWRVSPALTAQTPRVNSAALRKSNVSCDGVNTGNVSIEGRPTRSTITHNTAVTPSAALSHSAPPVPHSVLVLSLCILTTCRNECIRTFSD